MIFFKCKFVARKNLIWGWSRHKSSLILFFHLKMIFFLPNSYSKYEWQLVHVHSNFLNSHLLQIWTKGKKKRIFNIFLQVFVSYGRVENSKYKFEIRRQLYRRASVFIFCTFPNWPITFQLAFFSSLHPPLFPGVPHFFRGAITRCWVMKAQPTLVKFNSTDGHQSSGHSFMSTQNEHMKIVRGLAATVPVDLIEMRMNTNTLD